MSPETLRTWISAAGGRRFLMAMGAHLINTGLLIAGVLSEQGYLFTFGGTIAVYVGANTYQKVKESASA